MLRTVTCTKCNRADFPPQVMLHIFHSLFPSYAFHCAVVLKLVALQLNSKTYMQSVIQVGTFLPFSIQTLKTLILPSLHLEKNFFSSSFAEIGFIKYLYLSLLFYYPPLIPVW